MAEPCSLPARGTVLGNWRVMGETYLLLQLVYSIGHTLMAWLFVFLDHGVLQILLEL